MKAKHLFGAVFIAVLGGFIALFTYTRFIDKPVIVGSVSDDSSNTEIQNARSFLTSLQMQEGQVDFTYAAEQTVHAVVHVHTKSIVGGQPYSPFMEWLYGDRYSRPREVSGYGSGVIISSDGYIITNNHVIEDAESVDVTLNDRRIYTAKVIGTDESTDIALLKIDVDDLPYIRYGDSENLRIGDWVLAVGNPFNLTSTVTAGIVSAKGRNNLDLLDNEYSIESFIQTDAALNVGNSGGALVDTKGLLVGITSAIISPSGAYAGYSFAIPVTIVKKVIEDLKEFGEVQRAIIGVNIRDVTLEDVEKFGLDEVSGVMIAGIIENGSAEDAGLEKDDIIIGFDDKRVSNVSELQEQVGKFRPGDRTTVTYLRNKRENKIQIVLKNIAGNTNVVTSDMNSVVVLGAKLESLTTNDRRAYRINYGVKVTELDDGKFKNLGIEEGDIILSINGRRISDPSDVRQIIESENALESIGGIQSDGTVFTFQLGN